MIKSTKPQARQSTKNARLMIVTRRPRALGCSNSLLDTLAYSDLFDFSDLSIAIAVSAACRTSGCESASAG